MTKVLQVNCYRSRPVHDLALATANNIGASILAVSEPNIKAIRNRKDWIYDPRLDTAIKILNPNLVITRQGHGQGYSYISTKEYTLYSCYMSPNDNLQQLDDNLNEIGRQVRQNREEAVIVGDFNAKSPQWGLDTTDRRGELVAEWLAENDLIIVNEGTKPTFRRKEYSTILDLTVATEKIRANITKWEVSDEESLSDHSYIVFEISHETNIRLEQHRNEGWQVRKLDTGKLSQALREIDGNNKSAKQFSKNLTIACDKSMPRRKNFPMRKAAYWWTDQIAELRKECMRSRRIYTRNVRRLSPEEKEEQWNRYKNAKQELKGAIKKAKRSCWINVCSKVDSDIWGDGYKIVMKMMSGFPPKPNLTMEMVKNITNHLFPVQPNVEFDCNIDGRTMEFTLEQLRTASAKLKSNKAPGPGFIPPEIIKRAVEEKAEYILSVYNNLAEVALFPTEWKQAKLVLLQKGNGPLDNPASFRPICLLDVEGKLFEQLILVKLNQELERTGGLSDRQYGFRKGRQTVDAIKDVLQIASEASNYAPQHRRICAAVTLDVKNAFNSASWQFILEALNRRKIENNLICLIASYLSERKIILQAEDLTEMEAVSGGVPQGSVLGPTLWNVLYDDLLRLDLPEETKLIGFADDIIMMVTARNEDILMNVTNTGLARVSSWMSEHRLQLAPQKTEAVILTTRRKILPIHFNVQSTIVTPRPSVKYLGVWLDSKLTFAEHTKQTIQKAERTITALSSLMPNMGAPRASKRRLLSSVVHSQLLYGAAVWCGVRQNKRIMMSLNRVQRLMSIRVCSAYRTISTDAVGVIAGIAPIGLQITERHERYNGVAKSIAREHLMQQWQDWWDNSENGRYTHLLIPNIVRWINRKHGEVDYFVTQALSGHGCFNKYLHKFKRSNSPECKYCKEEDDALHTLFECTRWDDIRREFSELTGRSFDRNNMMEGLTTNEEIWNHVYQAIKGIINTKEREERQNQ